MKPSICALALTSAAFLAAPASAGTPIEIDMVCAVGGEKFKHWSTASYSTFGARPDGKPYGSWTFPLAIPECPTNKLVMYRDFEEDEIEALTDLVQSDDYKSAHSETTYYRASWLSERMDPAAPMSPLFLLMRAAWQVDDQPEVKARYQRELASRVMAMGVDSESLDNLFLHLRAANAYRELGEFPAALAALDAIPTDVLDVEIPSGDNVDYKVRREAEGRRYLLEAIPEMRKVIEKGDTSSEPIDLMPTRFAADQCADLIEAGKTTLPERCNEPEMVEQIRKTQEWRAERKKWREERNVAE